VIRCKEYIGLAVTRNGNQLMITKWDKRYLRLAYEAASWSKDPSTKVGCTIARPDKSFCSLGFNGLPMGVEDTEERLTNRDLKYPMVLHAEVNAINFSRDPSMEGYTLYNVPFMPCSRCAGQIIQKKISRVVAPWSENPRWKDDFELALKMFGEAKVLVEFYNGPLYDNQPSGPFYEQDSSRGSSGGVGSFLALPGGGGGTYPGTGSACPGCESCRPKQSGTDGERVSDTEYPGPL
jgi:dCMP deaminase